MKPCAEMGEQGAARRSRAGKKELHMQDIKSMTPEELTGAMRALGQPAFRGGQIFSWLHRGVKSFDEMTNPPKDLRRRLAEVCALTPPQISRKQVSQDGTIKYLWKLADSSCVESVLMG